MSVAVKYSAPAPGKVKTLTPASLLLSLCLLLAPVFSALAQEETQDIDVIRQLAEQFALEQVNLPNAKASKITARANNIDPRLRLAACDDNLESFSLTPGGKLGRITVGLRCVGLNPWTLYIPVQVDAMMAVLITTKYLQRGETPGNGELEFQEMSLSEVPNGYLTDSAQVQKKQLVRNIQPGTILTTRMFQARELIKRGQEVVIQAVSPGIEVKINGIAMENGVSGQLISVQNINSGRIIQALVQDDSTVVVNL